MRGEGSGTNVEAWEEKQYAADLYDRIIPVCKTWTQGFQNELLSRIDKSISRVTPEQSQQIEECLISLIHSFKELRGDKSPTVPSENLVPQLKYEMDSFISHTIPFFEGRKEKFYNEPEEKQRVLKGRFIRMYNVLRSFKPVILDILAHVESQEQESSEDLKELIDDVRKNTAFNIFVSAFGKGIRDWGDGEDRNPEDGGYICQRRNFGKFQGSRAVEGSREMITGNSWTAVLGNQEDANRPGSNVISTSDVNQLKRDIIAYGQLGEKTMGESTTVGKDDEPAFFIKMTINTDVRDGMNRPGGFPEITIVGDYELVNKVIQFLAEHPNQYYEFIGNLFTQEEAPITKKQIIDKATPTPEIVFLNAAPLRDAILQGESGLTSREGRITEKALEDSRFSTVIPV